MTKVYLFLMALLCPSLIIAQSIGINTNTPDASAALDISTTNKGLLPPRIALTDVTSTTTPINSPAEGLIVYNTNATVTGGNGTGYYYFDGTQWTQLNGSSAAAADNDWIIAGNDLYKANSGNVGIGSTTPLHLLDMGTSQGHKLAVFQNSAGTNFYGFGISGGTLELHAGAPNASALPRMTINGSTGNVGIGILNPGFELHVNAPNQVHAQLQFSNTTTGTTINDGFIIGNTDNRAILQQQENAEMEFWTSNTEQMVLDAAGNLGIGITNPQAKLHIDSYLDPQVLIESTTNGDDASITLRAKRSSCVGCHHTNLTFENYDNDLNGANKLGQITGFVKNHTTNLGDIIIYNSPDGNTLTETMRTTSDGNVGIGVSDPQARLHVEMTLPGAESLDVQHDIWNAVNSVATARWQSYTAGATGWLTGVALKINVTRTTTISIYEGEGISGTLLYSGPYRTSAVEDWDRADILGVPQVAGQKYTIHVANGGNIQYSTTNTYPGLSSVGNIWDFPFQTFVAGTADGFRVDDFGVSIGNYTLPLRDGTVGEVISTDGNGALGWYDVDDLVTNFWSEDAGTLSNTNTALVEVNNGLVVNGKTTARQDLVVAGDVGVNVTGTAGAPFHIQDNASGNSISALFLKPLIGSTNGVFALGYGRALSSGQSAFLHFYPHTNRNLARSSISIYGKNDILNILGSGNVGVGTLTPLVDFDVTASAAGATDYVAQVRNTSTNNSNSTQYNGLKIWAGRDVRNGVNSRFVAFHRPNNAEIGRVDQNSSSGVRYATSSDVRLKTNITPTKYGIADLMALEVKDYEFKSEVGYTYTGFIAQDLHKIYPDPVSVGGDDVKSDPWMVDYGLITPLLVQAIQDQQEIINKLEQRIQQLESK